MYYSVTAFWWCIETAFNAQYPAVAKWLCTMYKRYVDLEVANLSIEARPSDLSMYTFSSMYICINVCILRKLGSAKLFAVTCCSDCTTL